MKKTTMYKQLLHSQKTDYFMEAHNAFQVSAGDKRSVLYYHKYGSNDYLRTKLREKDTSDRR